MPRSMAAKKRKDLFRWLFFLLVGIGLLGICYIIAIGQKGRLDRMEAMGGTIYQADLPLAEMPEEMLAGLLLLRPEQMVQIPVVDGFQSPVGGSSMSMVYDAQPFGTSNPARGGYHTGQDLNGIGGENTDEGEAVHAAARGLVLYSAQPSESWGNVVVIAHRLPKDGSIIQTLYAHLKESSVRPGQWVERGQPIGTIGTANGNYLAHLHFEAIASPCLEAGMPGYHPAGTMNRMDPAGLIAQYPAPAIPDPYGTIRRIMKREAVNASAPPSSSGDSPQDAVFVNPSQFIQP